MASRCRLQFTHCLGGLWLLLCACGEAAQNPADSSAVVFIAFGDTHYGDPKGAGGDFRSKLEIEAINSIGRYSWPNGFDLKRRAITNVRGVILAGDITDDGTPEQWQHFEADFGLNGERLLKFPVMEGYAGHDFTGDSDGVQRSFDSAYPVVEGVKARNAQRRFKPSHISSEGGHYSWDWGAVHFVNLDLKVSDEKRIGGKHVRRYPNPYHALAFLKEDLANYTTANQPIVIIQHFPWRLGNRMRGGELRAFKQSIRSYNVVALLHAHTHGTSSYSWCGLPVFDVGSPHFDNKKNEGKGHFSIFRITPDALEAVSIAWTPDRPLRLIIPGSWKRIIPLRNWNFSLKTPSTECERERSENPTDDPD